MLNVVGMDNDSWWQELRESDMSPAGRAMIWYKCKTGTYSAVSRYFDKGVAYHFNDLAGAKALTKR